MSPGRPALVLLRGLPRVVPRQGLPRVVLSGIALFLAACSDLKEGDPSGTDASGDGAVSTPPDTDASVPPGTDGAPQPTADGAVLPGGACRPSPLPCLDPSPEDIVEIPTEKSFNDAVAQARAGSTLQIRGLSIGAGFRVPALVTLRGCAGAKIVGGIAFAGTGGTIEGFEVTGQIVANRSGTYVVRENRFVGSDATAGVEGNSIDGLVSAEVKLSVVANLFTLRPRGIAASTRYDTGIHTVDLVAQNNVFRGVNAPVVLTRGGLVGKISARVESNTIHGFGTAFYFGSVDRPSLVGNLLSSGTAAVGGDSAYQVSYSLLSGVTSPGGATPLSGAFATGNAAFMDEAGGDFRLTSGSSALDRIPAGTALPADDFAGCPRPVGRPGAPALGDIGAFEAQ